MCIWCVRCRMCPSVSQRICNDDDDDNVHKLLIFMQFHHSLARTRILNTRFLLVNGVNLWRKSHGSRLAGCSPPPLALAVIIRLLVCTWRQHTVLKVGCAIKVRAPQSVCHKRPRNGNGYDNRSADGALRDRCRRQRCQLIIGSFDGFIQFAN